MNRVSSLVFRGLSAIALIGLLTIGSGSALAQAPSSSPNVHVMSTSGMMNPNVGMVGASLHRLGSSTWTLQMVFTTGTFTYMLSPLTVTAKKLSGTVLPPNTSCPGQISGSLNGRKLKMVFTFTGTPCFASTASLKGTLNMKAGTGKGTFTANYDCTGTCTWSGTKGSSSNWNFQMTFDTGTYTYIVQPLNISSSGAVSGNFMPPNTSCPGTISGTYSGTSITMAFSFAGTPCSAAAANLTGNLSVSSGTASGSFTANYDCSATCSWTGTKTS